MRWGILSPQNIPSRSGVKGDNKETSVERKRTQESRYHLWWWFFGLGDESTPRTVLSGFERTIRRRKPRSEVFYGLSLPSPSSFLFPFLLRRDLKDPSHVMQYSFSTPYLRKGIENLYGSSRDGLSYYNSITHTIHVLGTPSVVGLGHCLFLSGIKAAENINVT